MPCGILCKNLIFFFFITNDFRIRDWSNIFQIFVCNPQMLPLSCSCENAFFNFIFLADIKQINNNNIKHKTSLHKPLNLHCPHSIVVVRLNFVADCRTFFLVHNIFRIYDLNLYFVKYIVALFCQCYKYTLTCLLNSLVYLYVPW